MAQSNNVDSSSQSYDREMQTDRTGSTGPVLPEPVLVTGFCYRNRVLPESVLPEISNGSVRSLSYRIGTGLDRPNLLTGSFMYR
ncbi:hypothetical protein H5410_049035 [Solanum commersonii]|uniref:Uncharacterized protein n=1 Tax=Solanum commersonii TaxID=4109 RepID=A0A9J5XJY8_SOLCO|nr:hypothetical protein H5410_049035 [Solanum commersonii]